MFGDDTTNQDPTVAPVPVDEPTDGVEPTEEGQESADEVQPVTEDLTAAPAEGEVKPESEEEAV